MDFSQPPWGACSEPTRTQGLQVLLIVVAAVAVIWIGRIALHGVLKALIDREASKGTAQELSAIEVRKRMDTLDRLGGNVITFFVVAIAILMILGAFGLN